MNWSKLILFILLFSFTVHAQLQDDYNDVSYLDMNFKVNGGFNLVKQSSSGEINELYVDLTFFPRDELNQDVIQLKASSSPAGRVTEKDDSIEYYWSNPAITNYNFNLNSNVKIRNALVIVDKKINFPLEGQDTFYTKPTEFIDVNEDIRKQAQEIVQGEDDLYIATFKIATWIQHNIKYDLSTLTAEAVQKSSWVLKNKEGVCDEITNLFISMARSVGIPARYISGMAYTNTKEEWGPHAWAEVYFPGKGWVPFDITYGQMGWVDPTHIKVKTSIDSAIRYSWKAVDVNFVADKLDISTQMISKGSRVGKQISMEVKPLVDNVGPGSYVPVEVEIENRNSNYFPTLVIFRKAPELIESNYRSVLLKPRETKREFWIVKIPEKLEQNFMYYSTLEVEDTFHYNTSTVLTYSHDGKIISLDEAKKIIDSKLVKEENKVSYGVSISCNSPEAIYYYQELDVSCTVQNRGNTYLVGTKICIKEDCKEIKQLGISEQTSVNFKIKNLPIGNNNLVASINNKDLQKKIEAFDSFNVEVLETPGLQISGVYYNTTPNYEDNVKIDIALSLKLPVEDIRIFINDGQVFAAEKLERSRGLSIFAKGKNFAGTRTLEIKILYKDLNGKEYSETKIYTIEVQNSPWYVNLLAALGLI